MDPLCLLDVLVRVLADPLSQIQTNPVGSPSPTDPLSLIRCATSSIESPPAAISVPRVDRRALTQRRRRLRAPHIKNRKPTPSRARKRHVKGFKEISQKTDRFKEISHKTDRFKEISETDAKTRHADRNTGGNTKKRKSTPSGAERYEGCMSQTETFLGDCMHIGCSDCFAQVSWL